MELSSGKTVTEPSSEAQVDSRNWKQELFASAEISAPEIRYKYHPERGDLLDRLRKANTRRREAIRLLGNPLGKAAYIPPI